MFVPATTLLDSEIEITSISLSPSESSQRVLIVLPGKLIVADTSSSDQIYVVST